METNRTIFNNKILTSEILKKGIFWVKSTRTDPATKKLPNVKTETGAKARNVSCGVEVSNPTNIINR